MVGQNESKEFISIMWGVRVQMSCETKHNFVVGMCPSHCVRLFTAYLHFNLDRNTRRIYHNIICIIMYEMLEQYYPYVASNITYVSHWCDIYGVGVICNVYMSLQRWSHSEKYFFYKTCFWKWTVTCKNATEMCLGCYTLHVYHFNEFDHLSLYIYM